MVLAGLFLLCLSVPSQARLLLESTVKANDLAQTPYTNVSAFDNITCDAGGAVTENIVASSSTQLKSCTCYTSTSSSKVGAIKININGTEVWLRTYNGPQ